MKQPPMAPQDYKSVLDEFDVTKELPFKWGKTWLPIPCDRANNGIGTVVLEASPCRIFRCEAVLIAQPGPDCWLEDFTVGHTSPFATAGRLPGELFDAGKQQTLADVIAGDPQKYEHKLPVKMPTCDLGMTIRVSLSGTFKGVALWGTTYQMR